jgi:uncharacterized protein with von Willebrand factor type A (vWA) domain
MLVYIGQVAYFNETFTVWEPLIEPLEDKETGASVPWQMMFTVRANDDKAVGDDGKLLPHMSVALMAADKLEMTVTKSCLDMFKNLGQVNTFDLMELCESCRHSAQLPRTSQHRAYRNRCSAHCRT